MCNYAIAEPYSHCANRGNWPLTAAFEAQEYHHPWTADRLPACCATAELMLVMPRSQPGLSSTKSLTSVAMHVTRRDRISHALLNAFLFSILKPVSA